MAPRTRGVRTRRPAATRARPASAPDEPRIEAGTRLGRLLVRESIGEGELGRVHRAVEPGGGSVVVKVPRGAATPEGRERFRDVADRLVELRHPNLVGVLEHGEHRGLPYLVSEHVPGVTLRERLRRAAIGREEAVRALRAVAAAVDHAHACGMVHGRLRTDQVLLDRAGTPLLSDAGAAALGGVPGSEAGDRRALAAMAHELLVDQAPDPGAGPLWARRPTELNPSLPPAVDDVLVPALEAEPAAAGSCGDLVDALADALGLVQAAPPAPPSGLAARLAATAGHLAGGDLDAGRLYRIGCLACAVAAGAAALLFVVTRPLPIEVTSSPVRVRPGETVIVTVDHLPSGKRGTLQLGSDIRLGSFHADGSGVARAAVRIPDSAGAGDLPLALCWDDRCSVTARLAVLPPEGDGAGAASAPRVERTPRPRHSERPGRSRPTPTPVPTFNGSVPTAPPPPSRPASGPR